MLKIFTLLCALSSLVCAYDLHFAPLWMKHQRVFELVNCDTGKVAGSVNCWILYDHEKGVKEGCISSLEVKRGVQGQGLGKYLFSKAIDCIEVSDIVHRTVWYAYPKWKEEWWPSFEPSLEKLVAFYKRVGGIQDERKKDLGIYFHFDHTNRKLVAQRVRDAHEVPEGYKVRERKEENKRLYAVRVYDQRVNGKLSPVLEVQYEKQGRANVISGAKILNKRFAAAAIEQSVALATASLRFSANALQEALVQDKSVLPGVYDDLFIEWQEEEK